MHYRERVTNADEVLLTKGRRVLVSRKKSRFQVLQSALSRKAEGVEASAIGDRMNNHKNALLTRKDREALVPAVVEAGLNLAAAARHFRTRPKTVAKWAARFRSEGVEGLCDRSSKPHSLPNQTPSATRAAIVALRRQRHTGKQIAIEVGVSPATVSRVLRRLGLNSSKALEPAEPPRRRYERASWLGGPHTAFPRKAFSAATSSARSSPRGNRWP